MGLRPLMGLAEIRCSGTGAHSAPGYFRKLSAHPTFGSTVDLMPDSLGSRLKVGVIAPATNTVVQPECDGMRPRGVSNQMARVLIPDTPVDSEAEFANMMSAIRSSIEGAHRYRHGLFARDGRAGNVGGDVLGWRPRCKRTAGASGEPGAHQGDSRCTGLPGGDPALRRRTAHQPDHAVHAVGRCAGSQAVCRQRFRSRQPARPEVQQPVVDGARICPIDCAARYAKSTIPASNSSCRSAPTSRLRKSPPKRKAGSANRYSP